MSRRLELAERLAGFKLHDYQQRLLLDKSKKRLISKSRQAGISTMLAIEAILDCIQNDNYVVLLLSKDEKASVELLKKIKTFIRNIPGWQSLVGEKDRQDELELSTGSRIISLTSNPENARGYTANHIILDEFAVFKEIEDVWAAALPTISLGGRITVASTPKGPKNKFYSLWMGEGSYDLEKRLSFWEKYELPWWNCPHLTEKNIAPIREEMESFPGLFEQEYCCSFIQIAGSMFRYDDLEDLVVEDVDRKGQVILGWDPASVKDKSVVVVLQKNREVISGFPIDKKVVLCIEELSDLPYPEQAKRVMELADTFSVTKVVVDAGGVGNAVIDFLNPIRNRVVRFNFTSGRKVELAMLLKSDITKNAFAVVKGKYTKNLFQEMCAFDFENTKFRRIDKSHSDFFAALLLSYSQARTVRAFKPLNIVFDRYGLSLAERNRTTH